MWPAHDKSGSPLMARMALGLAGVALLSGCASNSSTGMSPVVEEVAVSVTGTGGQLVRIASDNVAAAGYDADTRTMFVEFEEGSLYSYSPVAASVWESFLGAQPHPWSQVGYPVLVEGGVPYRKLR